MMCSVRYFFIFLMYSSLPAAAQQSAGNVQRYALHSPEVIELQDELREISGLVYRKDVNSVFAISDDNGYLFQIPLSDPEKVKKWKFHKTRDFEGIAQSGNTFFVLNSNGNIKAFDFTGDKVHNVKDYRFPYGGKNEFEILYADEEKGKLMIICKKCEADKKKVLSVFSFDPEKRTYKMEQPVDVRVIAKLAGKDQLWFKPSAAAIHPLTGEVYIISSINKLLVITDRELRAKSVYPLRRSLYKQPEGLSFTSEGDMIISNEQAGKGNAQLLYLKYHR